jgi:hypothetical protein
MITGQDDEAAKAWEEYMKKSFGSGKDAPKAVN